MDQSYGENLIHPEGNKSDEMDPMILKSQCLSCGTDLEFEAEQSGEFTQCPSCGQQTRLGGAVKKSAFQRPQAPDPKQRHVSWVYIAIIATLFSVWMFICYRFQSAADWLANAMGFTGSVIGAVIIFALGIWTFILCVMWSIFPVIVWMWLKRIHTELVAIRKRNDK